MSLSPLTTDWSDSISLQLGDDFFTKVTSLDGCVQTAISAINNNPEASAEVLLAATARLIHHPELLSDLVHQAGLALDSLSVRHLI